MSSEGIKALRLFLLRVELDEVQETGSLKAQNSFFGVLHKNALFQTGFIQGSKPMVIWWLT